MRWEGQREATRTAFTQDYSNPKQCHTPGGPAELRATIRDEKATDGHSYHVSMRLSYVACAEDRRLLENDSGLS